MNESIILLLLDGVQTLSFIFYFMFTLQTRKYKLPVALWLAVGIFVIGMTANALSAVAIIKLVIVCLHVFLIVWLYEKRNVKKAFKIMLQFMGMLFIAEILAGLLVFWMFMNIEIGTVWTTPVNNFDNDTYYWMGKTMYNLIAVSMMTILFSWQTKVPTGNKIKVTILTVSVALVEFVSMMVLLQTGSIVNPQIAVPVIILISVVPIMIYYICVSDTRKAVEYTEKDMQTRFAELKSEQVMDYYHLASKYIRTAHTMRHDMANEIQCLKVLMETDREKSMQFVDEMKSSLKSVDKGFHTGFSVVDVLLTIKSDLAEEQAVPMNIAVHKINVSHIAEVDLCNLLSNILDNAIEASVKLPKEERQVIVKIDTVGEYLMIKSENRYDGSINRENDKYLTSKADKKGHGYGLSIIQDIAAKYGGETTIATEEHLFSITVILRNCSVPKN